MRRLDLEAVKEAELLDILERLQRLELDVARLLRWERAIVALVTASAGAHAAGLI